MTQDKYFNLVDENWIPVQGIGLVSLRRIFEDMSLKKLGGNAIQKIALFKLLCAVGQAAWTPETEDEWAYSSVADFCSRCLAYLDTWHEKFWLYAESPFLQMPEAKKARVASFAALNPEKASGNTTVLTEIQQQSAISEADKALLLVTLMGFATGGKKVDNSCVLTSGYEGKSKSGKVGPSLGIKGFLHSAVLADNIASTLWLNIFSRKQLEVMQCYPEGIGTPPWEEMPQGENCAVALRLKNSLMGRLVPLSRFCLLDDNGMHYTEGIAHDGYLTGKFDPTQAIAREKNKFKTVWADPDKKPWRSLTAILSFLGTQAANSYVCSQVELGMSRARGRFETVTLWSGGIRVTSNAGEQYLTGSDDLVESQFEFPPDLVGEPFLVTFSTTISQLEDMSKVLFSSVSGYYQELKDRKKTRPDRAVASFWEVADHYAQELINSSLPGADPEQLRQLFRNKVKDTYDASCPHLTARQLQAWANHQPYAYRKDRK